jgi:hypothetical protein
MKAQRGRFTEQRAYIHKPKSAVATKICGRLEYSRYMTYQARVVGPSEGTTSYGSKFEEAYCEGTSKARNIGGTQIWTKKKDFL